MPLRDAPEILLTYDDDRVKISFTFREKIPGLCFHIPIEHTARNKTLEFPSSKRQTAPFHFEPDRKEAK